MLILIIVMCSLKLGNLFLANKMELKVGDFGLATKLEFDGEKKRYAFVCEYQNVNLH